MMQFSDPCQCIMFTICYFEFAFIHMEGRLNRQFLAELVELASLVLIPIAVGMFSSCPFSFPASKASCPYVDI